MLIFKLNKQLIVNLGSQSAPWTAFPPGARLAIDETYDGSLEELERFHKKHPVPVIIIVTSSGHKAATPPDSGMFMDDRPDNLRDQEFLDPIQAAFMHPMIGELGADDETDGNDPVFADVPQSGRLQRITKEHGAFSPTVYQFAKARPAEATPQELAFLAALYNDQQLATDARTLADALGFDKLRLAITRAFARGRLTREIVDHVARNPGTIQKDIAWTFGLHAAQVSKIGSALENSRLVTRSRVGAKVAVSPGPSIDGLQLAKSHARTSFMPPATWTAESSAQGKEPMVRGPFHPRFTAWTLQDQYRVADDTYRERKHSLGPYAPATIRAARELVVVAEKFIKPQWQGANYSETIVLAARQASYMGDGDVCNRIEGLVVLFEEGMQFKRDLMVLERRAGNQARIVMQAVAQEPGIRRIDLKKSFRGADYELNEVLSDLVESGLVRREKQGNRVHLWPRDAE